MVKLPLLLAAAVVIVSVGAAGTATAAYTISATGVPTVEQFTNFAGTSAPSNWTVAGTGSFAWRGQNDGAANTNGGYSYGAASSTDRSVGFLASSSSTTSATAIATYANGTGKTANSIELKYDAELWRVGGRASTFDVARVRQRQR
ncbi:MAG TPA: hypothetical protein VGN72_03480 [Tepidisphaeraceae bacterium]|jgi:hypothetical protein|nr:hypothetical protein [Tepidisphaeraceae bacterium]